MARNKMMGICLLGLLAGCSDSLHTLDGPKSGKASGVLCDELEVLTAATDSTVLEMMTASGRCFKFTNSKQVKVIRTVMMPGDGKYSQVSYSDKGKDRKLWIKTSSIKAD